MAFSKRMVEILLFFLAIHRFFIFRTQAQEQILQYTKSPALYLSLKTLKQPGLRLHFFFIFFPIQQPFFHFAS